MKFFKKLFCFFFFILTFILLHCYAPEMGRIDLLIQNWTVSIGVYIIAASFLAIWFVLSTLKSFFSFFVRLFSRDKKSELLESIDNIAELIQLDGEDFSKLINKLYISSKFEIIKKSLITQKNYGNCKTLSLTGNKLIDIKILKAQLQDRLSQDDVINSIELARKIINNYGDLVPKVQDEVLRTAILTKRHNLNFSFDPRKYKYNLSPKFIKKYLFSIDLLDLDVISDTDSKLKLIEKITKKHDEIADSYNILLKFIEENNIKKYDDKRIIEIIKKSFEILPNRDLAYDLIRLNKHDQFEVSQEITKNISDDNIEKLWFLLIVSLKSGFYAKAREIVKSLETKENIGKILTFYYKNNQEEILNLDLIS
jgi:hypothetical protein